MKLYFEDHEAPKVIHYYRFFLKYLHAYSFAPGESVKNLKIDITAFEVEINTQRGDEIKKYMAKKFKIVGSVVSSDSLYLKVAL